MTGNRIAAAALTALGAAADLRGVAEPTEPAEQGV